MASPPAACDHGYSTELPDGTDPYRDVMNSVMRQVLSMSCDATGEPIRFGEIYKDVVRDVKTRGCWDKVFRRKVLATGLHAALRYSIEDSEDSVKHLLFGQIAMCYGILTRLEAEFGKPLTLEERPTCRRDYVLSLCERAPCACFDYLKQDLMTNLPRTDFCSNRECRKQYAYMDMQVCAKCQICGYCSVDCQDKDWPRHKKECKQMRKTAKAHGSV